MLQSCLERRESFFLLPHIPVYSCCLQLFRHVQLFATPRSPPGSSVHGIFQARMLEQVAISCSRGSSQPRDQTWDSHISCIDRRILYHWATREAPSLFTWCISFLGLPKQSITSIVASNDTNALSHSSGGWKSEIRCWQGHAPSEGSFLLRFSGGSWQTLAFLGL